MNRTDRLVAMVMFLQGRRVVRAEELAEHFEITVRTVYRDIVALSEAGVPVSGEAGVGYSLVKGYHLPPVMFTADEAMAFFIGGEMVRRFADASLVEPMDSALLKIRSVLPRERQDDLDRLATGTAILGSPRISLGLDQRTLLPIQQAIVTRRVLKLTYHGRGRDDATRRDVEPMGVVFHGSVWYLVAWCRLRNDFRHFRLDRVRALEVLSLSFLPRPKFSLRRHMEECREKERLVEVRIRFACRAVERARRESYTGVLEGHEVGGGMEVKLEAVSFDLA